MFTANASAALKLVGECFPFSEGSTYVLPEDAHNSVHGIRQFAKRRGAEVCYISATPQGGVEEPVVKVSCAYHLVSVYRVSQVCVTENLAAAPTFEGPLPLRPHRSF